MQTELDKTLPIINSVIPNNCPGLWFINLSLSSALLFQLYFLPFTTQNIFNWGFWGWLVDMVLSITLLVFLTGIILKADWARKGLLKLAWLFISSTLIGLLLVIGFYDVSRFEAWHFLIVTGIFIWNVWAILFLTKNEILRLFKSLKQR